jgi:hypothetical protein
MCENNLIENSKFDPIDLNKDRFIGKSGYVSKKHTLSYVSSSGHITTLLKHIPLEGIINYATIEPISNEHNVINGYRIIIGLQQNEILK